MGSPTAARVGVVDYAIMVLKEASGLVNGFV